MNKNISLTILVATALTMLTATNASATSWRINNDATKHAHFNGINAAMSSTDVVAGDTLYLDPGCVLGEQTVSKRVTIMGTGYASTVHTTAKVGSLTITAANVKVEGVYCTGTVNPRANYITLERCRIDGGVVLNSGYTAQYLTVRQCMVNERIDGLGSTSTNSMGWTIENCIIRASVSSNAPVMELYNPVIRNNYLRNSSTATSSSYSYVLKEISGGIIQNNILLANVKERVLLNVSNSTVQNNVMSCPSTTYASSYPDNVCLDMANGDAESKVFAKTGNDMNYYRLADESPAKGAGIDGADCGPFAGAYPYAVYGYPYGMPYFTGSEIGVRAVDGKVSVKQTVVIQND